MIKRYYQRREAKCNFCFEWYQYDCTIKYAIQLCGVCLDKALKTTCYKVPSPDGKEFYQLYLFKNNVRVNPQHEEEDQANQMKNCLIENIDEYRNQELKKLSNKWAQITNQIKKLTNFGEAQMQKYTKILEQSLKNYPSAVQLFNKNKITFSNKKVQTQDLETENPPKVTQQIFSASKTIKNSCFLESKAKNCTSNNTSPIKPLREIQIGSHNRLKLPQNPKDSMIKNNIQKSQIRFQKNGKFKTSGFYQGQQNQQKPSRTPPKQSQAQRRKQQFIPYTKQKREKDLQQIAQNALKSKIYHYLQTYSSVPPALYLPMTLDIYDAIQNTSCLNKCIQLVSHNMQQLDIKCYLNMLQWVGVDVLKLVKVGLSDQQFKDLLSFLKDKRIQTLAVTSNKLTEESVINLKDVYVGLPQMKYVYLGRNRINKYKVRDSVKQMQSKFVLYL